MYQTSLQVVEWFLKFCDQSVSGFWNFYIGKSKPEINFQRLAARSPVKFCCAAVLITPWEGISIVGVMLGQHWLPVESVLLLTFSNLFVNDFQNADS